MCFVDCAESNNEFVSIKVTKVGDLVRIIVICSNCERYYDFIREDAIEFLKQLIIATGADFSVLEDAYKGML